MSHRPSARPVVRLLALLGAFALSVTLACAEGARGAGTAEESPTERAATAKRDSARRAPQDTVDSLTALRRATVQDTGPLPPLPPLPRATAARSDSTRRDTTAGDTTKPRRRPPMAGPQSGDRHPAYGGVGSPLDSLWPVKGPAPLAGSILPGRRIIAFYGNPKSTRMGILGALDSTTMLQKLDAEVAAWTRIDPGTPAIPALHVIVLVADGHPGPSGKYRTRHDSAMIEKVYGWARSRGALMFVDLQVGQSTLQAELPWIEKFLVRPDVHLGIDPEFSMKNGGVPGKRIGTYDAADINYASRFLANLVDKHKLPPKILVVHRFTPKGVTNARNIKLDPRVQVVMHMDGFGAPWLKRDTYWRDIKREPVQFAGWKQFTRLRNDNPPTPRGEILRLWPVPLYIQIQ